MGGRKSMQMSSEASAGMVPEEATMMSEGFPAGSCLIQMLAECLEAQPLPASKLKAAQRQHLLGLTAWCLSKRVI